ncbi:DUF4190 domain-containing protein [Streptomyces sp. NPDC059708]|uniref:DUF4190 domain-containing protein n=1 Tax=Streptomyces sp. NPDC059708 TaxID=3346916 RepID=UPI0036AB3F63
MGIQGTAAMGPAAGRNTSATAAVVLGALGLFTSFAVVGGVLGLAGLCTGAFGLRGAGRRDGGVAVGRARAVIGLVLSFAAVAVSVLAAVLFVWYANRTQECYRPDDLHQYVECVRRNLGSR